MAAHFDALGDTAEREHRGWQPEVVDFDLGEGGFASSVRSGKEVEGWLGLGHRETGSQAMTRFGCGFIFVVPTHTNYLVSK
jgi:hypothetical protein